MSTNPEHPSLRRVGPLLELLPGVWVHVAHVTAVVPSDDPQGVACTLVEAAGRTYAVPPLPGAVAGLIGDACLDWCRERGQAEEEGRLLALDSQEMPAREETGPDPTWDVGNPWP